MFSKLCRNLIIFILLIITHKKNQLKTTKYYYYDRLLEPNLIYFLILHRICENDEETNKNFGKFMLKQSNFDIISCELNFLSMLHLLSFNLFISFFFMYFWIIFIEFSVSVPCNTQQNFYFHFLWKKKNWKHWSL